MSKIIIKDDESHSLGVLIKGAIENEMKIIKIGIKKTQESLKMLEDNFEMSSEIFYKK